MKIVILSRGPQLYSTQSLVEAATGRGHIVHVLDHLQCRLLLSDHIADVQYHGHSLRETDALLPRIGVSATAGGAAVIRQFETMRKFTLLKADALVACRDKLSTLQRLAAHGIPIPKTVAVAQTQFIPDAIRSVGGGAVIIKTLESTHGIGVMMAKDKHTAISLSETLLRLNQRILIQEFVEEASGADYRALVVGQNVVATMKRQATGDEFRSNLHRGAIGTPVALKALELSLVKRATQVMGLEVAGVDIIRSAQGPMILEVNASPGLEGIENITGVDIAHEILLHLERQYKKFNKSNNFTKRYNS